jgi:hypothetical protein
MGRPSKLTVVKPTLSLDDVITKIRSGVAFRPIDLERDSGLSRATVRSLIDTYAPPDRIKLRKTRKVPAVQASLPFHEPLLPLPPADPPKPIDLPIGRTYSQIFWGVIAVWIGIVLAASGFIVNCQYWYAAGGNNLTISLIFCAMGLTADVITIAFPSWAAELRKGKNYWLCGIVFVIFVFAAPVSIIASAGFSGTHIGDTTKARGDAGASKQRLGKELDQKVVEHDAILKEVMDLPDVIEIQIQNERGRIPRDNLRWSRDCTDTTYSDSACRFLKQLRTNKAKAERRLVLEADIKRDTLIYEAMPSISNSDPAAEHVSQMTFGFIRPETVENYLINALAVAPILAGLFFLVATACFYKRRLNPNR